MDPERKKKFYEDWRFWAVTLGLVALGAIGYVLIAGGNGGLIEPVGVAMKNKGAEIGLWTIAQITKLGFVAMVK